MALVLVGIAYSLLLRSSIGMDIYNRDKLIHAVTLAGSSKMRIFVRNLDSRKLSVVVCDSELYPKDCV